MVDIEEIKTLLKDANLKRVNVEGLKPDVPLLEQGLDSLDLFNVFLTVEKNYNLSIDDEDYGQLTTINNIIAFINQKIQ
jgi:acyl carrier protein